MTFRNPTPIAIGMSGTFAGRCYRVAGRVVMGMEDKGQTYYWQEYNLVASDGKSATLVYEESESGGQWRLFTLFEPQFPLGAPAAAAKRVGDVVNLDGEPMRVSLADESRVYHIEGEAPEGVEVGDVARYFNAEAGNEMIVVSWTGEEIEFYRGLDLPAGTVATAFGLTQDKLGVPLGSAAGGSGSANWVLKFVGAFLAAVVVYAAYSSCRLRHQRAAPVKPTIPPSPLTIGTTGTLDGKTYRVQGHAVVEIAQVGMVYDRHEYQLFDETEHRVLLVCGSQPGKKDWLLFAPLASAPSLTPPQAAAKRKGDQVYLDGVSAPVTALFRSAILQVQSEQLLGLSNGDVFYGFAAQSAGSLFLARWNEAGITFYRGKTLPTKEVTDAFRQRAQKQEAADTRP